MMGMHATPSTPSHQNKVKNRKKTYKNWKERTLLLVAGDNCVENLKECTDKVLMRCFCLVVSYKNQYTKNE